MEAITNDAGVEVMQVAGGPAAGTRAAGKRPAGGPSSSLECLSNTVREKKKTKDLIPLESAPSTHICGNRFRDWFCPHCAAVQGPKLRKRVIDVIWFWKHSFMLTFTIDHDLFHSAEAAYKWVVKQRAISRVMKALSKYLASAGWFCVVEFQKDGGWPHWHVLVNAARIPIHQVRTEWKRFVPRAVRHLVKPKVESLGIVRYSKPDGFQSAKHAALYASKYLTKTPEDGYPRWALDAAYVIRRYSTSRGFWGTLSHRKVDDRCDDEDEAPKARRTHAMRIAGCCKTCTVYAVKEMVDANTGEPVRERRFLGKLRMEATAVVGIAKQIVERVHGVSLYLRDRFVSFAGSWFQLQCIVRVNALDDAGEMRLARA